jgi:hypothetical protein
MKSTIIWNAVWQMFIDISEEHTASVFRVEYAEQVASGMQAA